MGEPPNEYKIRKICLTFNEEDNLIMIIQAE